MAFDLIWQEKRRDWRWLWMRRKTVNRSAPISPVEMTKIPALRPGNARFAELLEKAGTTLIDP